MARFCSETYQSHTSSIMKQLCWWNKATNWQIFFTIGKSPSISCLVGFLTGTSGLSYISWLVVFSLNGQNEEKAEN